MTLAATQHTNSKPAATTFAATQHTNTKPVATSWLFSKGEYSWCALWCNTSHCTYGCTKQHNIHCVSFLRHTKIPNLAHHANRWKLPACQCYIHVHETNKPSNIPARRVECSWGHGWRHGCEPHGPKCAELPQCPPRSPPCEHHPHSQSLEGRWSWWKHAAMVQSGRSTHLVTNKQQTQYNDSNRCINAFCD